MSNAVLSDSFDKDAGLRPRYTGLDTEQLGLDQIKRYFLSRLEANGSQYAEVNDISEAPHAMRQFWQEGDVYLAQDETAHSLPWMDAGFRVKEYEASVDLTRCAVIAAAGIAESGSVMIPCFASAPSGLNFLPHSQCLLLHSNKIFSYFEDIPISIYESSLRNKSFGGAINFISGPSRTADIEQTLFIGAHGPKESIIVLYNKE